MTGESLKSVSQTILEYPRNASASLLNNWDTVKFVHDGYHAVSQMRTNSIDWNAASNFCSATMMKETNFLLNIVMGDEPCVHRCDPEEKKQR